MILSVDPPGRFIYIYFAFFLSSLLSAAAPSESDYRGKIAELQGFARAISRSTLLPLLVSKATISGLSFEFE